MSVLQTTIWEVMKCKLHEGNVCLRIYFPQWRNPRIEKCLLVRLGAYNMWPKIGTREMKEDFFWFEWVNHLWIKSLHPLLRLYQLYSLLRLFWGKEDQSSTWRYNIASPIIKKEKTFWNAVNIDRKVYLCRSPLNLRFQTWDFKSRSWKEQLWKDKHP